MPVIVTGAAGGIGSAVVRGLIDDGWQVVAMDIDAEGLTALGGTVGERTLTALEVDITTASSVHAAFQQVHDDLGAISALVNIAGGNLVKPLTETTDDDWDRILSLNLTSTFLCCRAAVPLMTPSGGRIINMSSIFGIRGEPNEVAYSAAKAGVIGLTRALAAELAERGITVNALAPVATLTPRVAAFPKEFLDRQLQRIPLRRFGETEDVVRTVQFLLSDGGGFYTGQTFSANGGDVMP